MDLSDVSIDVLVAEVKRRLDCQTKPEKRVILVGMSSPHFPCHAKQKTDRAFSISAELQQLGERLRLAGCLASDWVDQSCLAGPGSLAGVIAHPLVSLAWCTMQR